MRAYYDDGRGIQIFHGDCREVLPTLPRVDACVTDPPFGIDFDYGGYDDSPTAYPGFMRDWLEVASEVVSGPFFVWQAMLNAPRWHEWFPLEYRILAACKGFVQYRPQSVQHSWDPVIFWGALPDEPSVYRKDWHIQNLAPFGAHRRKIAHPCPRPLEQVQYVVCLATTPGQTVLDPFLGSGTTLLAAKRQGRSGVGIEVNESYCEEAARRLDRQQQALDFGHEVPA